MSIGDKKCRQIKFHIIISLTCSV